MHAHHVNKEESQSKIKYAMVGILFDTNYYNKNVTKAQVEVIDRFFDSMQWNKNNNPTVM